MRRPTLVRLLAASALLGAVIAVPQAAGQLPVHLEAQVVDIAPPVSEAPYDTLDYGNDQKDGDDKWGTTTWRVVEDTGNCCENYLTISQGGRLLDFGGRYVNYSDDRGLTWKSVQPLEPLVNGEGAIAMAPNGDVVGVEWDPYSGDHLLAFKYEALTGKWLYNEVVLHQPFYDREWISVVPGPFAIDGEVVPYITFVKGGVPKELWYYSTDGLTYTQVTSKFLDKTLDDAATKTLATGSGEELDWVQPNPNGGMTTLGGLDLLTAGDIETAWSLFDGADRTWYGVVPEGADAARLSVLATPSLPADVDLYLQRQLEDGSWSGDLISATSGSQTEERMATARLLDGSRYRIEVHLWSGAPATEVALSGTFYNSDGVAGT